MSVDYLVTGGLGFIGSAFVRRSTADGASVAVVDAMTYASDIARLENIEVEVFQIDVADAALVELVDSVRPRTIVHMAAESHVTRSEGASDLFFRTNVEGTRQVLAAARASSVDLVIHVSTDEVYGPCPGLPFRESQKEPGEGRATSAYARSKALADDLALSHCPEVPVIVARPTNCFGPWQHPEKAVPRWIIRALTGHRLPVWGDGKHVRDWMFVEDLCLALDLLCRVGVPGEAYNIAPENAPASNMKLARTVAELAGLDPSVAYLSEYDRPDHDRRYAVDSSKLRRLGWRASGELSEHLASTVDWYRENGEWWSRLIAEAETLYNDAAERG